MTVRRLKSIYKKQKMVECGFPLQNYKDNCAIDIQIRYHIEGKESYELHATIEKG